ncbi:MAG TPA: site-specific DNA-methyltransferase [Gelria sp.]|jgi:site-specific DNA-methyltransferase (adenine-specific)|nr:site-specific DNA-methyltransferase [Gelria sp.]
MENNHGVRLVWQQKDTGKAVERPILKQERAYIFAKPLNAQELFPQVVEPATIEQSQFAGRLIQGNNRDVLKLLQDEGYEGMIDLIYIDPPYLSENKYSSRIKLGDKNDYQTFERLVFKDEGKENLDSYLNELYICLQLMKELLSSRGSIFVHLDWHVSHYVRVILDELFGAQNFINEIVWCYGGGSGTRSHFHRKHDLIFWYSRSEEYIFNPQYRPYSPKTINRGLTRIKGNKYNLHHKGALMQDWWTDINKILSPTAYENLKFPTQKPLALLKRIIASASYPDSLIADFYSGSGTTAAACEELQRRWIICDNSPIATNTAIQRLVKMSAGPFIFDIVNREGRKSGVSSNLEVTISTWVHSEQYRRVDIEILSYSTVNQEIEGLELDLSFKSLIEFWEIDPDYQERGFCSQVQVVREKALWDDSLPVIASILIPYQESGAIAVKVYDIFGESCTRIFTY